MQRAIEDVFLFQGAAMASRHLTAAAGEHFVCYALSMLGFNAALVRQGTPFIDILASNDSGSRTIGIQVKSTAWAQRERGRGAARKVAELQFPLGHKIIEKAASETVTCFVDLKQGEGGERPVVYVVPTVDLKAHFEGEDIRQYRYFRLHRGVESMDAYRDNWKPVIRALTE